MKLLIDLGNTSIRIGQATAAADLVLLHSLQHAGHSLNAVLAGRPIPAVIESVHVASVAAQASNDALDAWLLSQGLPAPDYAHSVAGLCGVNNSYAEPQRLGVDRWLAVIAAHKQAPGAACVVDAGTAVTVDVVDAQGQHLGGLIAPGVHSQRRSMASGTGQVRPRDYPEGLQLLGQSSEQALAWGSLHSVVALVETLRRELHQQHGVAHWYLTGGEAGILLPQLSTGWQHCPNLVLEGLAHVADTRPAP